MPRLIHPLAFPPNVCSVFFDNSILTISKKGGICMKVP
nr:MAG TPA: hypothetical protein [Caudoviricetes sp.]